MEKSEILSQVLVIFKDVLDEDGTILNYETTANDVEEWDSLTHIQLVVAIEKHFNLRFNASEIRDWVNVGAMCDAIILRLR